MSVVDFPAGPEPEPLLVGPFEVYRVVVEGRAIPKLTGRRNSDGSYSLTIDGRFGADFPDEATARQAAWLIGQGMAVMSGYTHLGAESKNQPFAPMLIGLPEVPK